MRTSLRTTEEIQMTLSSGNNFSAYYVKSNFHFGKQMKFGTPKSIRILINNHYKTKV
jgi:hypothetical protein